MTTDHTPYPRRPVAVTFCARLCVSVSVSVRVCLWSRDATMPQKALKAKKAATPPARKAAASAAAKKGRT
jgi:hypothetical protein